MGTTEPKRCLGCGYILEHLPEPRCPECGRAFDPGDSATYWSAAQLEPFPALGWIILAVTAAALPFIAMFAVTPLNERVADVVVSVLLVAAVSAQVAVFARSVVAVVRSRRTAGRGAWYAMLGLSLLCLVVYGDAALSAALCLLGLRGIP